MNKGFLDLKQIPAYTKLIYDREISIGTIKRWKRKHPLPLPCSREAFEAWYEARMNEKAARNQARIFGSSGFHRNASHSTSQ